MWRRRQLTTGTRDFLYHAHSYYDIPVFDPGSRYLGAHRMGFADSDPAPDDAVTVGFIDCDGSAGFQPIGQTMAWSWQQGPMVQWRPTGRVLLWNDRERETLITRVYDLDNDTWRTLPAPTYAVSPNDDYALSLNMARLDTLRPGYGYAGASGGNLTDRAPAADGVWRMPLDNSEPPRLVLSLERAVTFLFSQLDMGSRKAHEQASYHYWFNHAKISPDGRRFTVKLRFKRLDAGWDDRQGVSLTCGTDGEDLRLLAEATSHVIWLDSSRLYFWQQDGFYLYRDDAPRGQFLSQIGHGVVSANAHLRYMPDADGWYLYDTPYREVVELYLRHDALEEQISLGRFTGHRPRNGHFRCDIHPCPSPDGRRVAVTSLMDGGRQVYLLEKHTQADESAGSI